MKKAFLISFLIVSTLILISWIFSMQFSMTNKMQNHLKNNRAEFQEIADNIYNACLVWDTSWSRSDDPADQIKMEKCYENIEPRRSMDFKKTAESLGVLEIQEVTNEEYTHMEQVVFVYDEYTPLEFDSKEDAYSYALVYSPDTPPVGECTGWQNGDYYTIETDLFANIDDIFLRACQNPYWFHIYQDIGDGWYLYKFWSKGR